MKAFYNRWPITKDRCNYTCVEFTLSRDNPRLRGHQISYILVSFEEWEKMSVEQYQFLLERRHPDVDPNQYFYVEV